MYYWQFYNYYQYLDILECFIGSGSLHFEVPQFDFIFITQHMEYFNLHILLLLLQITVSAWSKN
jgi:hypothetical protein